MTKLELTDSWPTIVRMASEGASLREIAEEVDATPGAINVALKRNGIEKAPAPPGPRARRGASPPPPKAEKVHKVKSERPARLKAAKAPKAKTFPAALSEVIEGEFRFVGYDVSTPEQAAISLRVIFRSLGLISTDNLSDDADCSDDIDSDATPSVQVDADSSGEDDNGDCDGSVDTDDVVPSVSGDFDGLNVVGLPVVTFGADSQPSVVGEVIAQTINEDGGLSVQIAVDPNEVTLRGEEVIESPDDWGTPPSFTIPSDDDLDKMNREDLRKLAANPGLKGWAYLKGYSKMSHDDLRRNLARVRDES